jgi:NDP-sugar pyrophosphorylase family protein
VLDFSNFFDLTNCPCPGAFTRVKYPWELLSQIPELIEEILAEAPEKYEEIGQGIWVGEGTTIADTAVIVGPALIGAGCQIRPNAYIRGNVIVGDNVVIGNASEVKQAIVFSDVQLPHYNYVGDSILGRGVHLGAGAILSNLKSVKGNVSIKVDGQTLETGRRKLGAILADGVEVGCNAVLNPGTVIGPGSIVYPLTSPRGYIPAGMIFKGEGRLVPLRQP